METETVEKSRQATPVTCVHGRLIENVPAKHRRQPGKVRCLECGAIFDDPHNK